MTVRGYPLRHCSKRCERLDNPAALAKLAAKNRREDDELRAGLLANAGGCGSPTCRDPDCQVPPGQCHQAACEDVAATAPQTDRRKRWVVGSPTLGCSRHGPVWLAEELREHRGRGLRTGREASQRLGVVDLTPYVRARALEPDERGRGGILWFPEGTLALFEREQARKGNGWSVPRLESFYRARWLERRAEQNGGGDAIQALERAKDRAAARRRRLRGRRGGRGRASAPPAHHREWLAAFIELQEYHERRACTGDLMPSDCQL